MTSAPSLPKILAVDDRLENLVVLEAILSQMEAQVVRASSGREALTALENDEYALVLLDLAMPAMDGFTVARRMRLTRKSLYLPVILITAMVPVESTLAKGYDAGVVDFLAKPISPHILRSKVQVFLNLFQAERKLRDSLREKELLLQEVHHRVKNNLQIICSLLNMQASAIAEPAVTAALEESQRRVESMAAIHEMLYASNSLSDIDFAEYAQALTQEVANSYGIRPGQVRLAFHLEPVRLEIHHAIPCGLILNELLTNAFKYAFPQDRTGAIDISLRQRDNFVRLTVEDTGVGLPQAQLPGETKSLGLRIVDILTRQLGGNLEIVSNGGAQFALTFPAQDSSRNLPATPVAVHPR